MKEDGYNDEELEVEGNAFKNSLIKSMTYSNKLYNKVLSRLICMEEENMDKDVIVIKYYDYNYGSAVVVTTQQQSIWDTPIQRTDFLGKIVFSRQLIINDKEMQEFFEYFVMMMVMKMTMIRMSEANKMNIVLLLQNYVFKQVKFATKHDQYGVYHRGVVDYDEQGKLVIATSNQMYRVDDIVFVQLLQPCNYLVSYNGKMYDIYDNNMHTYVQTPQQVAQLITGHTFTDYFFRVWVKQASLQKGLYLAGE